MGNILKQATDIIKGHFNEATNKNSNLREERLEICRECPIFIEASYGPVCDNNKWINPKTNESSLFPLKGYVRGCGCRLNAKTTLKDNHCIVNKW